MREPYKVSIVIPIYNVEEYLCQCIKSVIGQTYDNLEIILVDDGSPDSSPDLCDEWAKKDSRIVTIHKENGGLSDARNAGLLVATGDYILYVDSDDYLDADTVEWMVCCAGEYGADIVACTCRRTNGEDIEKHLTNQIVEGSGIEMLEFAFANELWFAWGKLIKTKIAKECPFVKGLIYEDVENTPRVFLKASKIVFSLDGRYHYRIRTNSIMGENKNVPRDDIVKVIGMDCEFISNAKISTVEKNRMYSSLFKQLVYNYNIALRANSCKADAICKELEMMLRRYKSYWISNCYISKMRRVSYIVLCNYSKLYKFCYRIYSVRGNN